MANARSRRNRYNTQKLHAAKVSSPVANIQHVLSSERELNQRTQYRMIGQSALGVHRKGKKP